MFNCRLGDDAKWELTLRLAIGYLLSLALKSLIDKTWLWCDSHLPWNSFPVQSAQGKFLSFYSLRFHLDLQNSVLTNFGITNLSKTINVDRVDCIWIQLWLLSIWRGVSLVNTKTNTFTEFFKDNFWVLFFYSSAAYAERVSRDLQEKKNSCRLNSKHLGSI